MSTGRRVTTLLVVLAVIGLPALGLRALCVGESCRDLEPAAAPPPFCPLPAALRDMVEAGVRDGRSPDVLAATVGVGVRADLAGLEVPWPAADRAADTRVPIVFLGAGVGAGSLPRGAGLDQIAPSLERILGYDRPHPEVRSGRALPGLSGGPRPTLVVEVAWKGVGTPDLEARSGDWPFLRDLIDGGGEGAGDVGGGLVGTLDGTTGSLPLDPAATLATIGTGGLPFQHGITGTLLRAGDGSVVRAWERGSPTSIIAALPDDLDHDFAERSRVGAVLTAATDRGIVGGTWYLGSDRDDVVLAREPLPAIEALLNDGYGLTDRAPDVIGVVIEGSLPRMDRLTAGIVGLVRDRVPGSTVVVTATGSLQAPGAAPARIVARRVDKAGAAGAPSLVTELGADGLFLDRAAMSAEGIGTDRVIGAMLGLHGRGGEPLFADVYPSFAVAFARYC